MSISGGRNVFNSSNPDNVGTNDIVTPGEFNNAIKGMKTLCERYGVDKKLQDIFFLLVIIFLKRIKIETKM